MNRVILTLKRIALVALLGFCLTQTGCIMWTYHAVPAYRLPPELMGPARNAEVPINLALLRQEPPKDYLIGAGDTLGVYIQWVVPPQVDEFPPVLPVQGNLNNNYYPPHGQVLVPSVGVPFRTNANGHVVLPLVGSIDVSGQTLDKAAETIRKSYTEMNIIQPGRDRILISLLRPRVHRVLVIREDSGTDVPQMLRKDAVVFTKRGRAEVVDLPAFENDVLHALTATGGLPGLDCANQVWILRSTTNRDLGVDNAKRQVESGRDLDEVVTELTSQATALKIPLRTCPDQPLPFGEEDILLHDGDIIYLEPRIADVFYTGGLLPGGMVPLPRDHDVDVVEAVALANGSIGGPGGTSGVSVFRSGAGPGNIIPPTRVLILRKLPNGEQLPIRVDLTRAMHDAKERILIQPEDVVMLYYKPGEITGNVLLNFFNFNVLLNPKEIF